MWVKRQKLQHHAAENAGRGSMKLNKSTAVSCAKQRRQNERAPSLVVWVRCPVSVLSGLGSHHLRYSARNAMTAAEYKATREHLGTQADVARLLGVNRVTVAKRENGTMTITNEAVLAIQSLRRPRGKRKSENAQDVPTASTAPPPTRLINFEPLAPADGSARNHTRP
jgi:hypothetical protein